MKRRWTPKQLRDAERRGYRVTEQIAVRGRVIVNVVTPVGRPRTVELTGRRAP